LKLRPVPVYFFGYELAMMLDPNAYTAVVGPGVRNSALGLTASVQKPYDQIVRLSSGYDGNGKAVDTRLGYELAHIGKTHTSAGFELFDYESRKAGYDRSGGKVYVRRDLWPASYGMFSVNDHATAYFIRDQRFDSAGGFGGKEDIRNAIYRKRNEAIVGVAGSFGRYGPADDPNHGWRVIPTQEFAGHFAGGTESFWRSSVELQRYLLVSQRHQHKLALRGKIGSGGACDKNLFEIGGADGLRGYGTRDLKGSSMLLGGVEYRLPLADSLKIYLLDNIACLRTIQSVIFYDVGKSWYNDFADEPFKKDAGVGLRLHFDLGGILERVVVRVDVAQAIHEKGEDPSVWFGLSQAF
jgi:outer membrane protein assembly factor BamA